MAKVDPFKELEELHDHLNPPKSHPGDQLELLEDISELETISYAEAKVIVDAEVQEIFNQASVEVETRPIVPIVKPLEVQEPPKKQTPKPKKTTGEGLSFHNISNPNSDLTEYDRFQVDLTWISEANTRVYESLQYAVRELRSKDRYIDYLLKDRGDEPISRDKVFGVDPPKDEDMRKTVMVDEVYGRRFAALMIIGLFVLGTSLFAAIVAFIMRNI